MKSNFTGYILLTSTGLSSLPVYEKFQEIVSENILNKVVIITTASTNKENNEYSQLALSQLKSFGFNQIDFYDFENDGKKDLSVYDIIYVCGGNTFKLMKFAREMNFEKDIKLLLERGGVYIGVSAGSLIIGPSIQIADGLDKNEVELTDFKGFNIVDAIVFPHYSVEFEERIKSFEDDKKFHIQRLTNAQALLIKEDTLLLIE